MLTSERKEEIACQALGLLEDKVNRHAHDKEYLSYLKFLSISDKMELDYYWEIRKELYDRVLSFLENLKDVN